jgi:hypothetical protein
MAGYQEWFLHLAITRLPSHISPVSPPSPFTAPFREGVPLLVAMAVEEEEEEEADVVLVVLWPGRAEETEEEGVV